MDDRIKVDKILSAEEWMRNSQTVDYLEFGNITEIYIEKDFRDYAIHILEAFAEDVKSKAKVRTNKESTSIIVDKQSIDQLLTKFKEKL